MRLLCYSVHGGSGYSFTRRDFGAMSLGEIEEHLDWLEDQRRYEARQLERAAKGK